MQIFEGNTDRDTIVTRLFPQPVRAALIRIRPTAWNYAICMRFELIGCDGMYRYTGCPNKMLIHFGSDIL